MEDKIEILPVALLAEHRPLVEALKHRARSLRIELGWHYLLDLSWILSNLGPADGRQIMDAGAGTGLLQWVLAEQGADVISVDRGSRAGLDLRFRARYQIHGLRREDLRPGYNVIGQSICQAKGARNKLVSAAWEILDLLRALLPRQAAGRIRVYNQDLQKLSEIPDASLDAVVAVSALEHNTPEGLSIVVAELMRVLKPGGKLLATLGAAKEKDWFHEPSKGWNYTAASLRRLFDLPDAAPSNYARHDELFAALKDCHELRDNLAMFYALSGDNGMPWGKWDPQYQPVGVCKIKAREDACK